MRLFEEIWYDDSYGKLPRSYRRDNIDALLYYIKGPDKSLSTNKEKTITDVLETLNEEQKTAVYALIGELNNDETEGGENMKHKEITNKSNRTPPDIRRFIKKVKFNPPATIVFWTDNTKTVVKCKGEDYDPEKGLAMCICKKVLGDKGNYYEVFKKWLPKEEETESDLPKIAFKPETWTFDLKPIDINKKLFEVLTGANSKTTIEFKDTKEEPKHNPIEEAYKKLVEHRNGNGEIDLDELIGLLGEALGS